MAIARLKTGLYGLLLLAVLLVGAAFFAAQRPLGLLPLLLVGAGWAAWLHRDGQRLPTAVSWLALGLMATAAAAPATAPEQSVATAVFSYLGVIGVLLLWDLSRFWRRLQDVPGKIAPTTLVAAHLRRLGLLIALSLAVLAAWLWLPLSFNFDLALLGGVALAAALGYLLRRLRKGEMT